MAEYLGDAVEQRLAAMSEEEFDLLCARVRIPEEEPDPKVRAARALARAVGGRNKPTVTPEQAAHALRRYRQENR